MAELTDYYREHAAELPPLERDRLERNVLRLLDSKDPAMAALNAGAPRITDRLCDACADHFAARPRAPRRPGRAVPAGARASSAASTTTRGPRSSSTSPGREGQQQALGGGGRYDGLVELLGGRPTPGIGFGVGLDRLLLALDEQGGEARPTRRPPRSSWSAPTRTTP